MFLHNYVNANLKLERARKRLFFSLGQFFLLKSFHHIIKDANVLDFRSNDSCRLSYFLISTPSKHTSHHHSRSITSCQFFTYKYCRNPSLGLTTKARACKSVGQEGSLGFTFHALGNAKECEGWTLTLSRKLPFWELESRWTLESLKSNCKGQNSLD